MIIQGSKTNVSIPKEFMSIYNPDTQNYDATPQFPAQREEYYDSGTSTTKIKVIYTLSDTVVNEVYDLFGSVYGTDTLGDKYQIILSNTVQEYDDDPIHGLYGHYEHYKFTDSSTNITKYMGVHMRGLLLPLIDPMVIRNPQMYMDGTYLTSGGLITNTYQAIFDFSASASYSSTFVEQVIAGTSKNAKTYNFYLDNTSLKNALAAKADQYTTINLYHLDETPWS